MKRVSMAVALCVGIVLSGCVSVARVHRRASAADVGSSAERVPGIPFYVKKAACDRESTYLERLVVVTMTIKLGTDTILRTARETLPDTPELHQLLQAMAGLNVLCTGCGSPDLGSLAERHKETLAGVIASFRNLPEPPEPTWHLLPLIRNVAESRAYVDYSETYYLDAKRPWIGTASLSGELASDGTLTKTEVSAEDETLDTVLSAVAGVIPGLVGADAAGDAAAAPAPDVFLAVPDPSVDPPAPSRGQRSLVVSVEIRPVDMLHTFGTTLLEDHCNEGQAITAGTPAHHEGEYRREVAGGGKDEAPGGDGAIRVSGRIVLPEGGGQGGSGQDP